jgi:hypothetical protein
MSTHPVPHQIPVSTAPFFQKYRFETLDAEADGSLVIERILALGNREELGWLFHYYGCERIKNWVSENGARRLPWRRSNLWRVLLDLPQTPRGPQAWPY